MTNHNIPPHIAARMAEIKAQAAADGLTLPLSPYVIAVAEEGGEIVDLVTGEVSIEDAMKEMPTTNKFISMIISQVRSLPDEELLRLIGESGDGVSDEQWERERELSSRVRDAVNQEFWDRFTADEYRDNR